MIPGVGPGKIRRLIAQFGSPQAVAHAPDIRLARVDGIGMKTAAAIAERLGDMDVDDQVQRARTAGARMVTLWEEGYPALLKEIFDPPVFLWYKGRLPQPEGKLVAVVGTRRPSDRGKRTARHLSAEIAGRDVVIVSGLASGIDAEAHRGAIDAGTPTVAVLGSGVDRVYPSCHKRLAETICKHGALISEYAMGAAPDAANFPRRNRIISGMTHGTLVIEAYRDGGALITARLALEQNREVFAVPGSISSQAVAGCHDLIQQGHAKLTTCVEDVIAEIAPGSPRRATGPKPDDRRIGELPEIEQQILALLGDEPVHIDALQDRSGIDISTLLVHLLTLEFKGLARQLAGKQFYRT